MSCSSHPARKKVKLGDPAPLPPSQEPLQECLHELLSEEVQDRIWEFDAQRIAEMLSANGKAPPDGLVNIAVKALGNRQPRRSKAKGEQGWHAPLENFLNSSVEACHNALDGHHTGAPRDKRRYGRLHFVIHDKLMEDGVDDPLSAKPNLVGCLDPKRGDRAAWAQTGPSVNQVLLPVEIKEDWLPIIAQATADSLCLFDASPSRQFALVLGFQQVKAELRFLVFHHSGLTASKPLHIRKVQGQEDILRVFLSILCWESTGEAGLLGFHNDVKMPLPCNDGDKTGVAARVAGVLRDRTYTADCTSRVLLIDYSSHGKKESKHRHSTSDPAIEKSKHKIRTCVTPSHHQPRHNFVERPSLSTLVWSSKLDPDSSNGDHVYVAVKESWCKEGYGELEADLLSRCKDNFGTPGHHYSFRPTDSCGKPMSTARFLPTAKEQLKDYHWQITSIPRVPSNPPCRDLWVHVNKRIGRSLVHAKTPWQLCVAIGHGMLGWLSMLENGFLHGDIHIGNMLLLDPPVRMKPFKVPSPEERMLNLSFNGGEELNHSTERLESVIRKMGFSDECQGLVTDSDKAARLKDHLARRDIPDEPGTPEFTSQVLLSVRLWSKQPYMHSPVDDLESFYYTLQWAGAFNDGAEGGLCSGERIQHLRKDIAGATRSSVLYQVYCCDPSITAASEKEYGPFFVRCLALLHVWLRRLTPLRGEWGRLIDQVEELDDVERECLRSQFLVFGYRGVAEYLELLHDHRMLLEV